ncbi:MAG: hypothetical protein ACK53Y_27130, partial [bacterium]
VYECLKVFAKYLAAPNMLSSVDLGTMEGKHDIIFLKAFMLMIFVLYSKRGARMLLSTDNDSISFSS